MDDRIRELIELKNRVLSGEVKPVDKLTSAMVAGVRSIQEASASRPALDAASANPRDMNEGVNFVEIEFDLATLISSGPLKFSQSGVEIIYKKQGSNPSGRVTLLAAGRVTNMVPGTRIKHAFSSFSIESTPETDAASVFIPTSRTLYSGVTGKAVFVIVKRQGYDYKEPESSQIPPEGLVNVYSATAGGTFNTVNIPSSATDGISVNGVSGVRVLLWFSDDLAPASTGTIRLWNYCPFTVTDSSGTLFTPGWHPGQVTQVVAVADMPGGRFVSYDFEVAAGVGRIFAQVYGFTGNLGGGPQVMIQAWNGNGG